MFVIAEDDTHLDAGTDVEVWLLDLTGRCCIRRSWAPGSRGVDRSRVARIVPTSVRSRPAFRLDHRFVPTTEKGRACPRATRFTDCRVTCPGVRPAPVAASTLQDRFEASAALLDGATLTRTDAHGKHLFLIFRAHRPADRILHIHWASTASSPSPHMPAQEPAGRCDCGWRTSRPGPTCADRPPAN